MGSCMSTYKPIVQFMENPRVFLSDLLLPVPFDSKGEGSERKVRAFRAT
jgi:hypothetical protein